LLSALGMKKRITYWLLMIFMLGFSPLIIGNGYYGYNNFKSFLNPKQITYFREVVYSPPAPSENIEPVSQPPVTIAINTPNPKQEVLPPPPPPKSSEGDGSSSSFTVKAGFDGGPFNFVKNYFQSFTYSLLGPFPWQLKYSRQMFTLTETIPLYLCFIVSLYGLVKFIKGRGFKKFVEHYKLVLPALIFGLSAFGALSLFINNYGIIFRIRIPMIICFFAVMFIILDEYLEKYYEKISNNWRGWVYRVPFIRGAFKTGR
jgi:hypothetical protein